MKTLLVYIILLIPFFSYGQAEHITWKKQISMEISADPTDTGRDENGKFTRNLLGVLLIEAVIKGKITAYSFSGFRDTTKPKWIDEIVHPPIDTILDYNTGVTTTQVRKTHFTYDSICGYRVVEECEFDPITAKMTCQIISIGPETSFYGDGSDYRGRMEMFRVKYNDAYALNKRSTELLNYRTWLNNFSIDSFIGISAKDKIIKATTVTKLEVKPLYNTDFPLVRDESADIRLFGLIADSFENGRLSAWSIIGKPFNDKLKKGGRIYQYMIQGEIEAIDTPITTVSSMCFSYNHFNNYEILKSWSFNINAGKAEVIVDGIAPMQDVYNITGRMTTRHSMLWLRYKDVQPLLQQYDQYNPENSFALYLWKDFFDREKRPNMVSAN